MKKVYYTCINLAHSTERRDNMLQQAEREGIELYFTQAVAGSNWQQQEDVVKSFNLKRRQREHAIELTPNEHGCLQSHLRAYREFLRSDTDFLCVLEDDITLNDGFRAGVMSLVSSLCGWDVVKLNYAERLKRTPIAGMVTDDGRQVIFPQRFTANSYGYLYTRDAVVRLQALFEQIYWVPFDVQLGHFLLTHDFVVCGCTPCCVAETTEFESDIGDEPEGVPEPSRTLLQNLYHRWVKLRKSLGKSLMPRRLHKRLSKV